MPQSVKPVPPGSMCPFMSGPVVVNGVSHLFRAACAGVPCRLFDEATGDCRFNDVDYDDADGGEAPGDQVEPEPGDDPS